MRSSTFTRPGLTATPLSVLAERPYWTSVPSTTPWPAPIAEAGWKALLPGMAILDYGVVVGTLERAFGLFAERDEAWFEYAIQGYSELLSERASTRSIAEAAYAACRASTDPWHDCAYCPF